MVRSSVNRTNSRLNRIIEEACLEHSAQSRGGFENCAFQVCSNLMPPFGDVNIT
jgi:hypothetical protein